ARWPMDHDTICGTAIMGCDLLGPLEWRIASPCPADRIMWERRRVSPVIQMRHVNVGSAGDPVEHHYLIVGPFRSAFRARSVITRDVDKQRVIEDGHFL